MREKIIEPVLGTNIALPLSAIILSICIFIITLIFLPKLKSGKTHEYVLLGITWFILTNLFDLMMIIVEGKDISLFFTAFNPLTGNLWGLVVLTSLLAPIIVAKMRNLIRTK